MYSTKGKKNETCYIYILEISVDRLAHKNQAKLIPFQNNSNDCSVIGHSN